MVCDQPNRDILLLVLLIRDTSHLTDFVPNRFHRIDVKDRIYVLHNNGKPL